MSDTSPHEDDFKLLDSYQAFSAEIVRVSLLAIGAVGALYTLKAAQASPDLEDLLVKVCFVVGLAAMGIAAAFSLMHRYWSTDFMACHVRLTRLRCVPPPAHKTPAKIQEDIDAEIRARKKASTWSKRTVGGGPLFLALGATSLALGLARLISLL